MLHLRALPSSTRPALRTLCAPLLRRSLCAAAPPKEEGGSAGLPVPSFADEVLRGVGQVIFLNSPTSGAITLTALAIGDPWLGALAALGTTSATAAAHACRLDPGGISAGLFGYNGCLVGCAFSVFLGQPAPATALATVAGAALTAPLAAALKPACGAVP